MPVRRDLSLEQQLAMSYDLQLRNQAAHYSNMDDGRAGSSAYLDQLFHRLVDLLEPDLFVEAGAYRAEASRRVKSDHPTARVVAFEANPYNHRALSIEYDFAGIDIEYLHLAVAGEPGEVVFHLRRRVAGEETRPITGNSSLLERVESDTEYERIAVDAVSLDSFFGEARPGQRTAAWIDVEGAAGPLLQGGRDFLAGCALVMIEVEEREQWREQWLSLDVMAFLLAQGFVPVARDIEYEHQYNLVFCSAEFYRRHDVLLALQLHENFLVHHLSRQ